MFAKLKIVIIKNSFLLIAIFSLEISADSFDYNLYNNHGIVGLINTPTARSYDAGVHGVTIYGSDIDQKITVTSNPYDWFEASVFYMNTELEPTCRGIGDHIRHEAPPSPPPAIPRQELPGEEDHEDRGDI